MGIEKTNDVKEEKVEDGIGEFLFFNFLYEMRSEDQGISK